MKDLRKISGYYGLEHQKRKAIEELGELIVAIARDDEENIIEEIADVMVMMMQLEILLDCDEEVCQIIEAKVNRQIQRIRDDDIFWKAVDCSWR